MKRVEKKLFCLIVFAGIVISSVSCGVISIETPESGQVATPLLVVERTTAPSIPPAATAPSDAGKLDLSNTALTYNLPQTTLLETTGLFASPNRPELVAPVDIAAGEIVYIMGRNSTGSHLRVVWNTGVGWVPASFTDYNNQPDRMMALPIFQREPPACAAPLTTQFNLNNQWQVTGSEHMRVAVVIDLFRSQYGEFPSTSLTLTVNGQPVESSRRKIVEQGQFSLKDVVFTLPDYLQPGDVLGYQLETTSQEPLTFLATIFNVPEGCVWKVD